MVHRCVPVCVLWRAALLYLPLLFVADEVGEGFVGVGKQLVKIGWWFW